MEVTVIELPEHINIEEIPLEKRYKSVTAGLIRRIKILYEAHVVIYEDENVDYELAKTFDSVKDTIQAASGILIMLPRLKEAKEE